MLIIHTPTHTHTHTHIYLLYTLYKYGKYVCACVLCVFEADLLLLHDLNREGNLQFTEQMVHAQPTQLLSGFTASSKPTGMTVHELVAPFFLCEREIDATRGAVFIVWLLAVLIYQLQVNRLTHVAIYSALVLNYTCPQACSVHVLQLALVVCLRNRKRDPNCLSVVITCRVLTPTQVRTHTHANFQYYSYQAHCYKVRLVYLSMRGILAQ